MCSLNDVVLSGFEELPEEDQEVIIEFVMNKANWAKLIKRKAHAADDAISSEQAKSAVVVPGYQAPRQAFVIPVPGVNGARHNTLAGKAFVLTGIFPEVGGGTGLTLGKDRVKNMIEAFGGRVTGSISGKTDVLVVGKAPGFSKVSQARARLKMLLVNLKDLKEKGIEAGCFENAEHAFIASFSTGYKSNGLALKASEHDIAITAGFAPHRLAQGPAITKRKQSSLSAKDANPPAKKVTKAARKDSKHLLAVKTKKAPSKTKGNQEVFRIVCDGCGVDCTEKSWFVEENSTDWCNVCKEANGNENTLLQVNGITAT